MVFALLGTMLLKIYQQQHGRQLFLATAVHSGLCSKIERAGQDSPEMLFYAEAATLN